MCDPIGIECYKNITDVNTKCLTPCKGLYADVQKNDNSKPVEDMALFKVILDKEYRIGFKNEKKYRVFSGIFIKN